MDRIDAMKVFVAVLDEGSLAAASRYLKRSPTAVTRAVAALEARLGIQLLHRTTRSLRLSEAGERYAEACRRVIAEIEDAERLASGHGSDPRGLLTLSAPPIFGEEILRPILDQFLDEHPQISAHLLLLDRAVNLVEEGVDVALRVAKLPDSSLMATRIGGEVRRVVVASPDYLMDRPRIVEPSDLAGHQIIAFANFGLTSWTFAPSAGSSSPRIVNFSARLTVNSVRAALASALAGRGLTRLYSYHVAEEVQRGRLQVVLDQAEHPSLPVHLLSPRGRPSVPKVRAFLDFAAPRLRSQLVQLKGRQSAPPDG